MSQEFERAQVPMSKRWSRKRLLAVILVAVAIPSVFAIAYLSNLLHLGPYQASQLPIQVSQVSYTEVGGYLGSQTICFSDSSMEWTWVTAPELPSLSGAISAGLWYKTAIRFTTSQAVTNVIEHYHVIYSGSYAPVAGDLQLAYCSQTTSHWIILTPTFDAVNQHSWSGTVTTSGFDLPYPYTSTTPLLIYANLPGTWATDIWFEAA